MQKNATIIKMNQTIAEFVGWEFKPDPKFEYMAYFEGNQMWCDNLKGVEKTLLEGFKYHEDWNKLMPVFHKVREKALELKEDGTLQQLYSNVMEQLLFGTIADVHLAIYNFLTWYNQQKQNDE